MNARGEPAREASFMIHESLVPGHEYTVLSLPPISAWAVLFAGKDIESRAFATEQRGRVLIHAANERASLRESQARRAEVCFLAGLSRSALPAILARRAIIGSVEILDCLEDARSKWAVPGRHHWVLSEPLLLCAPIADVDGEAEFWRWTYERVSAASAGRRRTPVRSGIVPAVQAPAQHAPAAGASGKRAG
jgi:hypothetical protein